MQSWRATVGSVVPFAVILGWFGLVDRLDLIDLRVALQSVTFTVLAVVAMAYGFRSSRRILFIACAWLALVVLNRLVNHQELVAGTVERDTIRVYYAKSPHYEHDLIFVDTSRRRWHDHYFAFTDQSPVAPASPATATVSRGLLWDKIVLKGRLKGNSNERTSTY